ncbi:unnamed protein product [Porites lobata]|uniref:Sushi domain-containing protein n=1 Tax=Porites lobata TaxID=104759 RepID=A0ABN8N638_9CNID|nr:unnamed protein product [Porites lobata]
MYFKALFLFSCIVAACWSAKVKFSELKCQSVPAPKNGVLDCEKERNSQAVRCQLKCNQGYDVTYLAAEYYVCNEDGSWSAEPSSAGTQWPDCKIYSRGEPLP